MSKPFEIEAIDRLARIETHQKNTLEEVTAIKLEQRNMHGRINKVERHQATWTGGAIVGGAVLSSLWSWLHGKLKP